MIREVKYLIHKDLVVEWRQRYAINGILLYLVSTIFIAYLSFNLRQNELTTSAWNALFWIILLFTSVNAIAKSFMQESEARLLYYYSIASPQGIIFSKIIYNAGLMIILGFTGFLFYMLILGNPVLDIWLFMLNILLASYGFSASLTLVSAIASKAGNNATLMAILSFPVVIPILLMVINISKSAIDGMAISMSLDKILTLIAINIIVTTVSYILFPYLWRS